MPDTMPPSEYGGKVQRNGVQPFPHAPTPSEQLSLTYRTGDPSGVSMPDEGEAFCGLLPEKRQRALREEAGDLDKGQVWEEFLESPKPEAQNQE